jgi:hypothetical protein
MATVTDSLSKNPPPAPQRVYYSTGRMLGVDDFQADQDYHRGRLARALVQLYGTGTVAGLNVGFEGWQPNTPYPAFAFVYDSSKNVQVNTGAAGTSGSAVPAFAAAGGGTVNDVNGIVWTNEGQVNSAGWKPNTVFTFPTAIVDPNSNIQVLNVKPNLTSAATAPVWNTAIGGGSADGATANAWICAGPAFEIAVTPGMAIDRVGRIIEVPRTVCILLNNWLTQTVQAWQNQLASPVPGQPALPDPNTAIHDGAHLMCDVFATFVTCTRGLTPCFASEDDYDATDAFSANRWLDSFAMQLVLRTDPTPLTPADPWKTGGTLPAPGAGLTAGNAASLQSLILGASAGPAAAPVEYPPGFDTTSVFLARLLIAATAGAPGKPPTWDLTKISIDNNSRLFLYPVGLLVRLSGLGSGTET